MAQQLGYGWPACIRRGELPHHPSVPVRASGERQSRAARERSRGMTSRTRQPARSAAVIVAFGAVWGLVAPQRLSALSVERCVSQDNHLYVILSSSSDFTQVTSVSMTNSNANACCEGVPGDVLTA